MLLGYAHVEESLGKRGREFVQAGSGSHRGRDRDDFLVRFPERDQGLDRIPGCTSEIFEDGLRNVAVFTSKARRTVPFDLVFLGRFITLALGGQDVKQNRALLPLDLVQLFNQSRNVVPVDRAVVLKTQLLQK